MVVRVSVRVSVRDVSVCLRICACVYEYVLMCVHVYMSLHIRPEEVYVLIMHYLLRSRHLGSLLRQLPHHFFTTKHVHIHTRNTALHRSDRLRKWRVLIRGFRRRLYRRSARDASIGVCASAGIDGSGRVAEKYIGNIVRPCTRSRQTETDIRR